MFFFLCLCNWDWFSVICKTGLVGGINILLGGAPSNMGTIPWEAKQRKTPCPRSTFILVVCLAAFRNRLRGGAFALTKKKEKVRWITVESASIHHFHSDSTMIPQSLLGPKLAPLPIRRALRGARQRHPWRRVRRRKILGFKKEPRPTRTYPDLPWPKKRLSRRGWGKLLRWR